MASQDTATLQATIERQAVTLELLHTAAQKYKHRLQGFDEQLAVKQAEIDALNALPQENAVLREDLFLANEKARELEVATSRLTEQLTTSAETQAQLGVKVQAYQRHNQFLQGEVTARSGKLRTTHERIDVLAEEIRVKDRRITMLVEKLRQQNVDPVTSVSSITMNEEELNSLKEKASTAEKTVEMMRDRLESVQEEQVRREEVAGALQRENASLKQTVSRLVDQISGGAALNRSANTSSTLPPGSTSSIYGNNSSVAAPSDRTNSIGQMYQSPPRGAVAADKLAAYHKQRMLNASLNPNSLDGTQY